MNAARFPHLARFLLPWGTLVLVAVGLSTQLRPGGSTVAVPLTTKVSVSSPTTGVVATMPASVGVYVDKGAIVASLETAALERELALLEAERLVIRQTHLASAQRDDIALRRQWLDATDSVNQTQRSWREHQRSLAEAKAELAAATAARDSLAALVNKGLVASSPSVNSAGTVPALEARVQHLLAGTKAMKAEAERALRQLSQIKRTEAAPEGIAALQVQDIKIADAKARLEQATLRAPISGVIAEVAANVGEVVSGTAPLVTIIAHDDKRLLACPRAPNSLRWLPNRQVSVTANEERLPPLTATVERVGPVTPDGGPLCAAAPTLFSTGVARARPVVLRVESQTVSPVLTYVVEQKGSSFVDAFLALVKGNPQ